jgi:hypothetical protein
MVRQLIWFLLGWEGPIPIHVYSGAEYLIAFGGAGIALALYPIWFRLSFAISHRGKVARVGAWMAAIALAVAWDILALDISLFNTPHHRLSCPAPDPGRSDLIPVF